MLPDREGVPPARVPGSGSVDFTVVSFYTGASYYRLAALDLRHDCERLGIPHQITELKETSGKNWAEICRQKIRFYRDMLVQCRTPILWVDADCRIARMPDFLLQSRMDMIGYLRGFTYPRDFHRSEVGRFWTPSILYFNDNNRVKRFIDHMLDLEERSDIAATDDYFLEEAWRSFPEELAIGILPPSTLTFRAERPAKNPYFVFGDSGHVKEFASQVQQHTPLVETTRYQQAVLDKCMASALKQQDSASALVIGRFAFDLDPGNHQFACRYADLLRQTGDYEAAAKVLEGAAAVADTNARGAAVTRLAQLKFMDRNLSISEKIAFLEPLTRDADKSVAAFVCSRMFHLRLEERAEKLGCRRRDRPRLWWPDTSRGGNLAAIFGPYVVEKLTGLPPLFVAKGDRLIASGNGLAHADADASVWGAGIASANDKPESNAKYRAVRGPLTRCAILRHGGACKEVFGDPALLLPLIFPSKNRQPHYPLGLVTDFSSENMDARLIATKPISTIRRSYEDITSFIEEILDCEAILSTSLYGLIVAHAYGVPARWCTFSKAEDRRSVDRTKFADYFLSIKTPLQQVFDLSEYEVIDERLVRKIDKTVSPQFEGQRLLEEFPYELNIQSSHVDSV
jgi:hypothetical protein